MMSVLICPECAAENPPEAEKCWVCQASLAGVTPSEEISTPGSDSDVGEVLPQADDDLTGLLHSLKQEDDLSDFQVGGAEDLLSSPEETEGSEEQEDAEEEPELPEWLSRIRQRAQTEADSVGEVTQKIRTAYEILDEDKKEDQRRQFEGLIDKIHQEDSPQPPGEVTPDEGQPKESGAPAPSDEDWLTKIRKKHAPLGGDLSQDDPSQREGDSLLQWLVALEDGVEETDEVPEPSPPHPVEDTQEVQLSVGPLDATQEITLGERPLPRRKDRELTISREEQNRADQLSATILDEKAPRPVRGFEQTALQRGLRLVLGLVLIAILSLAAFYRGPANPPTGLQGPHTQAALDWVESLPEDASLLIVMDYQSGFSAELAQAAQPMFEQIVGEGRRAALISSTPVGAPLFYRLLDENGWTGALSIRDLGYFPAESFGAFGLAYHSLSGWQIRTQPAFNKALPAESFDGILILGDDYSGVMAWIEQLSTLMPDTPIVLLVSAQAGPLLLPYWESGQVEGMISGFSEAAILAQDGPQLANRWRAFQVGIVMMILMLSIGMSLPSREPEGIEGQGVR
jgi:hypothetical protein